MLESGVDTVAGRSHCRRSGEMPTRQYRGESVQSPRRGNPERAPPGGRLCIADLCGQSLDLFHESLVRPDAPLQNHAL